MLLLGQEDHAETTFADHLQQLVRTKFGAGPFWHQTAPRVTGRRGQEPVIVGGRQHRQDPLPQARVVTSSVEVGRTLRCWQGDGGIKQLPQQ